MIPQRSGTAWSPPAARFWTRPPARWPRAASATSAGNIGEEMATYLGQLGIADPTDAIPAFVELWDEPCGSRFCSPYYVMSVNDSVERWASDFHGLFQAMQEVMQGIQQAELALDVQGLSGVGFIQCLMWGLGANQRG